MIFFKEKIDESKSIPSIFKKDWRAKIERSDLLFWHKRGENYQKLTKKCFFGANGLVFESIRFCQSFSKINKRDLLWLIVWKINKMIQSWFIFLKDRQERFDLINIFKRQTRGIWSQLIFFKDWKDQKIKVNSAFYIPGHPILPWGCHQTERERKGTRKKPKKRLNELPYTEIVKSVTITLTSVK